MSEITSLHAHIQGLPMPFQMITCILFKAENESQLQIEPDFYIKNSFAHMIPVFPYYEMRILTPVWGHDEEHKIHWHQSEKYPGMYFVCLTCRVASVEDAKELFKLWCIGTAYTMITGKDFESKLREVHGNYEKFYDLIRRSHSLSVTVTE